MVEGIGCLLRLLEKPPVCGCSVPQLRLCDVEVECWLGLMRAVL